MIDYAKANALDLCGCLVLLVAAWPANGIFRTYLAVPWRASIVGRVLFSKAALIAAVLDLAVIAAILRLTGLGRPAWFEVFRLLVFLGVAVVLWWQRNVFRQIITDALHADKEPDHDH